MLEITVSFFGCFLHLTRVVVKKKMIAHRYLYVKRINNPPLSPAIVKTVPSVSSFVDGIPKKSSEIEEATVLMST